MVLLHKLTNRMSAGGGAHLPQTATDVAAGEVGPQHAFPHRVARREFAEQLAEVVLQRRQPLSRRFAPPAFFF